MGVRGRKDRNAFAASFEEIYSFRNVYTGTAFIYVCSNSKLERFF